MGHSWTGVIPEYCEFLFNLFFFPFSFYLSDDDVFIFCIHVFNVDNGSNMLGGILGSIVL